MQKRKPYTQTWEELSAGKNMIFLTGPRQSGKTTFSKIISQKFTNNIYSNWDIPENRSQIIDDPSFFTSMLRKNSSMPLVIFDEIHKYKDWKNYLKGIYDQHHNDYLFLITGSGRLDVYQKGSDSLAGRYFQFHLWPFTLAELGNCNNKMKAFLENPLEIDMKNNAKLNKIWKQLSNLSGFPEPYLSGKTTTYRRWSNTYSAQLIREDIRDLAGLKTIADVETLYTLLPSKVGSPLSIQSLSGDLKVSYNTINNWLSVFEKFYLSFSISPWSKNIKRAVHKERKLYLWDAPRIKNKAALFENMIALELFRAVSLWNDFGHGTFSLHYLKNKEKEEVDFLIANDNEPFLLIEAKLSDIQPSAPLLKFQNALKTPAVQLVGKGNSFRLVSNGSQKILIAPGFQWCAGLP